MALIGSHRIRFALPLAAAHWLLLVLIQCENFLGTVPPRPFPDIRAVRFVLTLPLLQTENLLAAAVVGLVACLLAGRRATRYVLLALWAGLSFYLVFDQVYYKVFFDHFRPSVIEGVGRVNAAQLFSSIAHELDLAFGLNSTLVVLCTALLAWRCVVRPRLAAAGSGDPRSGRPRQGAWLLPAGAAVLFVAGIPNVFSSAYRNVQHHPLLVLAGESTQRSLIDELRHGGPAPPEDTGPVETGPREYDSRLADVVRACRGGSRPPNVLLIVLESVGSRQLLDGDGLPSPQVTPPLAQLAHRGVVFESVYSVFPGTVRTHVAMTTGGRFLTWGSVYELLDYPYQGSTLPRVFAAGGYDTALFAGEQLDGENMAPFMRQAGYRTFYDFAADRLHHTRETMISSWGAREEFTIALIERWLDAHARRSPGPFFLNYLTAATHHPYGVPGGYRGPFPGRDGFSRYRNALHYTDTAIGKLLNALAAPGVLDETIVAVTGDHGEAFGTPHPLNFTHRNRLYEENIKSFLIVAPVARLRRSGPVVSHRVATTGDIMPTLLAVAGVAGADVPGRCLWDEEFTPRPVFFHKNIRPEQWGLRDGPWKFIAGVRDRTSELYDLARDPDEQVNLAGQHPDRVLRYDALCQRLFVRHDDEFTSRLQGYHHPGGPPLSTAEVRSSGPKRLAMGVAADSDLPRIVERNTFDPREQPIAYVRLVSYERPTPIEFCWRSPAGAEYRRIVPIEPAYSYFQLPFPGPRPMEQGRLTLSLRDPAGGSELLRTQFSVSILTVRLDPGYQDPQH